MSRAYKGLEIAIYGKVSERSAGVDNVAYVREKLQTMKMADFVRYLVGVGRRYESGELFGAEIKRFLAELQPNGATAPTTVLETTRGPATAAQMTVLETTREPAAAKPKTVRPPAPVADDDDLINDLLDSIQGLE
jgi:hypothetical protein